MVVGGLSSVSLLADNTSFLSPIGHAYHSLTSDLFLSTCVHHSKKKSLQLELPPGTVPAVVENGEADTVCVVCQQLDMFVFIAVEEV